MAKSASPICLQEDLMQAAQLTAKRYHRSTAEQIEYWADLGRIISSTLDSDVLLAVSSGLTVIKTEPVLGVEIEPEVVFEELEQERKMGTLANAVTKNVIRYQASLQHPGFLEQIDSNGNITTGQFENGKFIALQDERS